MTISTTISLSHDWKTILPVALIVELIGLYVRYPIREVK